MGATMTATIDISEVPVPPRKRRASFYFVLFFIVGPIWSIVPLSWLYVGYSLLHFNFLHFSARGHTLLVAAFLEALFSVYVFVLTHQISWPSPTNPVNYLEVQDAFKRVLKTGLANLPDDGGDEESCDSVRPGSPAEVLEKLASDDPRAIDFRHRLRLWFNNAPWSHIRLQHVRTWLYWTAFNCAIPPHHEIPKAHMDFVDETVALLEKRIGMTIPPGDDPSIVPYLLSVDPINVLARPLAWYLFIKFANLSLRAYYQRKYGVKYGRYKDLEYLIYIPDGYSRETGPDPVVLLHGLGVGILQYKPVLSHMLRELPDTPFLVPLQPQISQDIFHPRHLKPMLRHEKAACVLALLERLGWVGTVEKGENMGVTMLSHSNGTFTHAWMLKTFPEYIKRSCFVDPVTFCSWEGDVCYNFIYKPCKSGMELIIRYFVGTEIGVANWIQRHFDWLSNTLWFEEIPNALDPRRTLYVMGGKDAIVDAKRIKRYLTSHGVKEGIIYNPNGRHGQAMIIGKAGMHRVIEWIKDVPGPESKEEKSNASSVSSSRTNLSRLDSD